MTRNELIMAIYDNEDAWSCPEYNCDKPEGEGNTGKCCWECAERSLAKYDAKVRADAEKEYNAQLEKWEAEHTDALYRAEMKGRADAIEEYKKKIEFEYKWLLDCKVFEPNVGIAFNALKSYAEQLKEKK